MKNKPIDESERNLSKNNLQTENKNKKDKKKWYQLPIIGIIGIAIAIYSNSNTRITASDIPLQSVIDTATTNTTQGIVMIVTMTQTFYNTSLKTGFVNEAKVIPIHIDPSEYRAELLYIDKRRITPLRKNKVKFKTKITFKNPEVATNAKEILVLFYDNLGREIALKKNKSTNFRIEFDINYTLNPIQ